MRVALRFFSDGKRNEGLGSCPQTAQRSAVIGDDLGRMQARVDSAERNLTSCVLREESHARRKSEERHRGDANHEERRRLPARWTPVGLR